MGYKHYRASLALHIVAAMVASAAMALCISAELSPLLPVLLFLLIIYLIYKLWRMISHPREQVLHFLWSLRCGERMIRFPLTHDKELNSMYTQMNDIIKLYYENKREIETKKKYYDRILRIMTHEIRNTITPIISLSDFYLKDGHKIDAQELKEGMQIINNQSNNLKSFLDSYHTLTHLPEPQLRNIHIPELFHETWQLLRNEPEGHRIKIKQADITLYADPVQMQLILSNLLRNALHAIKGYDDGVIEMYTGISDKQPFIIVTDNGCGIPPERINDIFLPFYTTKEKGTGIGLSLSRQIMLLHGGELTAESNPEKRITTFTLWFPGTEAHRIRS